MGLEGGGGAAVGVCWRGLAGTCCASFASSLRALSLLPYLFNSSERFFSSSLLATGCSPNFSDITGPGFALWCSALARPPLVALSCSSLCIGCEEALESEDSWATWSVMSGEVGGLVEATGEGLRDWGQRTAGSVLFFGVGRHCC